MVIMFEATNGFHDAANAVATVIYTKSLQPGPAVVLSGVMNFVGVLVGGIAVAYALVELLPAEVLSPPDGGPAVAMLVSLFVAALSWNIGTWWLGLPNSSSHCLIGSLIGVALGNAFAHSRNIAAIMQQARPLIETDGDDRKGAALMAIESIQSRAQSEHPNADRSPSESDPTTEKQKLEVGPRSSSAQARSAVRDDIYQVISELKHAQEAKGIGSEDKKSAEKLAKQLGRAVEYAPFWVRMLSALCLGIGTMIGYKRIVKTLGERLGKIHLTPAQGASAEIVSAVLIGTAGFTGLPVSTTHIVTSGIAGTMVTSGAGLQYGMVSRILVAWVLTLPITIMIAGGLYYLLASPKF